MTKILTIFLPSFRISWRPFQDSALLVPDVPLFWLEALSQCLDDNVYILCTCYVLWFRRQSSSSVHFSSSHLAWSRQACLWIALSNIVDNSLLHFQRCNYFLSASFACPSTSTEFPPGFFFFFAWVSWFPTKNVFCSGHGSLLEHHEKLLWCSLILKQPHCFKSIVYLNYYY